MLNKSKMRRAGRLVRQTFEYLEPFVKDGVTTGHLDRLAHDYIISHNGYPAPLGYVIEGSPPFPKSICTAINEVVAHGIPLDSELLVSGDIISIDISLSVDGHYGDACRTYCVGNVSPEVEAFVDSVKLVHDLLLQMVEDNLGQVTTADIGDYTEVLAAIHEIHIFPNFGGHGIGRSLHLPPFVPPRHTEAPGVLLEPGMVITIEPIFSMHPTGVKMAPDGWMVYSPLRVRSAQVEHTILIHPDRIEVLT